MENYFLGVEIGEQNKSEMNFIFNKSGKSNLALAGGKGQLIYMDNPKADISLIKVNFRPQDSVKGIRIYDAQEKLVFEAGNRK